MSKIILGFVGQLASGKGTAAAYLKKNYGAEVYRFSTMLRDVADRLYIPQTRENLQKISSLFRENFSEDIMSRVMAEDVKNNTHELIVVDGIRRPADAEHLRQIPGFILVHIFAELDTRYERLTERGENLDDNQKTKEEFIADHEREAELKIVDIAAEAQAEINNNGTLNELYQELDTLVSRYEHKD